jgi:phosphoesterase RecJ-like protein
MDPDYSALNNILQGSERIVLTTHLIPDGDAIGSVLSLYYFLRHYGKQAVIINHSPTPDNLSFLDKENIIKVFLNDADENSRIISEADLICILDTNEYSRTKSMEPAIRASKAKKACIDHHEGIKESDFDLIVSNTSSPATCEILYDFISSVNHDAINSRLAECLYTGIITDTGSFRYPRTTADTFIKAADLVKRGADPVSIYDEIYGNNSINKVKLLARFVQNLDFYFANRMGVGMVSGKDFEEFNADVTDIEGFSGIIMTLKGVVMGVLIFELPHSVKVSFRSKGDIKVNELAKEFGGGGHKNAAGATLPKEDLHTIKSTLISAAEKYLPKVKNFV